jgi:hypothetical protein
VKERGTREEMTARLKNNPRAERVCGRFQREPAAKKELLNGADYVQYILKYCKNADMAGLLRVRATGYRAATGRASTVGDQNPDGPGRTLPNTRSATQYPDA